MTAEQACVLDEYDDGIEVPEQFICPITQELMTDPVVTRYGQSYERSAIVEWIAAGKDCPMTRQKLTLSGIITNHSLRAKIRQWQVDNEQDITLIAYDPADRMGLYGYFMIPKEEKVDETERSTDDEGEITILEVSRRSRDRTAPSQPQQAPRRRRRFLRRLRRGNNGRVEA
eukprot:scaffold5684_cov169-Amphora_coffeaeformis.AAC.15